MQAEVTRRRRRDGQQIGRGDCQPRRGAHGRIRLVLARAERDDSVVPVVAARKEHADERPVVGSLREGVDQGKALNTGGKGSGSCGVAEARLAGLQDEFAACDMHDDLPLHLILG
jgi:hypothetical protein